MMKLPTDCMPVEFWRGFLNCTEDEINGRVFFRLGIEGTLQLQRCDCENQPQPRNPFRPFDPW